MKYVSQNITKSQYRIDILIHMWYTQGSQYLLLSDLRRDCSPGRIKKLKRTKTGINQIKHNHLIPIDEKSRKMFYHPIIPIIHEHNCYFHDIYSMPELRNQSHTQVHHPHICPAHTSPTHTEDNFNPRFSIAGGCSTQIGTF